jgi:diguanylate cyclase (GGDEF)-like protein/PAS domain S-box-containing protein
MQEPAPTPLPASRSRYWLPALVILLLVAGTWFSLWTLRRSQDELRQNLLQQATLVARSLQVSQVENLAGNADDVQRPDYVRLKQQLASARTGNSRCRFLYILGRNADGQVYFTVDSEPADSDDYSPPGQIYDEATAEMHRSFSRAEAVVEGPIVDRWGTWVTALVPIVGSEGRIIGVLGMDIDAAHWQTEVAARAAVPIGLVVILAIGAVAAFIRIPQVEASPRLVMRRLLPALAGMIVVLLTGAGAALWLTHNERLQRDFAEELAQAPEHLKHLLEEQSAAMRAAIQPIATSHRVLEALEAMDTARLRTNWAPVLQSMEEIYGVSHLYFLDTNRRRVLHVQQADRVADAVATLGAGDDNPPQDITSGVRLSRDGDLLLRVVQPVYHDDRLVGYIELGKDVHEIVSRLHQRKGMSLAVLAHKQFLVRDEFERAMARRGMPVEWDRFPDLVVTRASLGRLPDAFGEIAIHDAADASADAMAALQTPDGRQWRASPIPLLDASRHEIGHLLVMRDVTDETAAFARHVRVVGIAGAVLLALLLGMVITLLRRTDLGILAQQKALAKSREQYMLAANGSNDGMWDWDLRSGELFFSPKYKQMVGFTDEEFPSTLEAFESLLHPEDRQPTMDRLERFIAGKVSQLAVEFRFRHKDGSYRWILSRGEAIRDEHGVAHRLAGSHTDITERKWAEDELRRLSRVVEQTPATVVITDTTGRIEYVNPAFERATGYATAEAIGQNPRILKSGLMPPETYTNIWRALTGGREWRGELQNRRKSGEIYWEHAVLSPLRDARGIVTHYLAVKEDITARKRMEEQLRAAATSDRLTGLPNRAFFMDRLQQVVQRAHADPQHLFAVLFLDFDRFKSINDSLGHEFGDLLLQEIANRLRGTLRGGECPTGLCGESTAARLGGDEFVVLLDAIESPREAIAVADRLLKVFSGPYQLGEHEVYSTASIGIVTSDLSASNADDVLRDADTAMYEAKHAGKGRYVLFDASMHQRVQQRLSLENDLRRAVAAGQLSLVYQPIVSLQTGKVESFESLVRWNHPTHGLVPPAEFIEIAEDTGLILPIGEWVLRESCRQFAAWRATMGERAPRRISVNLSRNQLQLPNLPQTIRQILEQHAVPPECLHLEITESAVMRDVQVGTRMLHSLREIGVKLDMDDFGIGHSSLACLHQFPIDVLKIDRSFVANINRGRDFAALVHAVAQLARNLNIQVVAEGVETLDQALVIQSLDCEFGQGYLFSPPMTGDAVPTFSCPVTQLPGLAA